MLFFGFRIVFVLLWEVEISSRQRSSQQDNNVRYKSTFLSVTVMYVKQCMSSDFRCQVFDPLWWRRHVTPSPSSGLVAVRQGQTTSRSSGACWSGERTMSWIFHPNAGMLALIMTLTLWHQVAATSWRRDLSRGEHVQLSHRFYFLAIIFF